MIIADIDEYLRKYQGREGGDGVQLWCALHPITGWARKP